MHRLALAAAFVLASLAPVQAQDDALRAAAERYVNHPVQQQMMDEMLSAEAMIAQMRAVMPQLSDDDLEVFGRIGAEEMAKIRPAMEAAMIDGAVATFTLEEILALEEFYATEVGASVMSKMQPYMTVAMTSMAPAMQSAQQRMMERVMAELGSR